MFLRVTVPLATATYDALLQLIEREYALQHEGPMSLGRLARMRWIADLCPLYGESFQVKIFDDGDVREVLTKLAGGAGSCRMALG